MVPKPEGKIEAGHGGTAEGRRVLAARARRRRRGCLRPPPHGRRRRRLPRRADHVAARARRDGRRSRSRQVRKRVPGPQAAALPAPDAPGRRPALAAPAAPPALFAPSPSAFAAQQQRRGLAHAVEVLGVRLAADQGNRLGRLRKREIGPM